MFDELYKLTNALLPLMFHGERKRRKLPNGTTKPIDPKFRDRIVSTIKRLNYYRKLRDRAKEINWEEIQ